MSRFFCAFVLIFSIAAQGKDQTAFNIEVAKQRCQVSFHQTPEVYANDFKWGYTLLEMSDRFEEIYDSGKRLNMHAEYNPGEDQFYIFYDDKDHLPVAITEDFIKSVTNQIEVALANRFADYVFFPDMGHSHLHFPESHWQKEYTGENAPPKPRNNLYQKMLADPKMKALYHLAEQLQLQDEDKNLLADDLLVFKYWHRNFVGYNDTSRDFQIEVAPADKNYNTVGSIDEHHGYSAGFAVSASKDGCFPYIDKDGVTRYFDIGLQDPRYDPSKTQNEFSY